MNRDSIHDPKGLMTDAFAIEGITVAECRSIFLDWALGLPAQYETRAQVQMLIAAYETPTNADHPMLATLREALTDAPRPKRRGGRQTRIGKPQAPS